MPNYFEKEVLEYNVPIYDDLKRSKFVALIRGEWRICRDQISHQYWKKRKPRNICIKCGKQTAKIIPKFILTIERLLGVKDRSKFYKAKLRSKRWAGTGVVIEISSFWKEHELKFSFLTAAVKTICLKPKIWDNIKYKTKSRKAVYKELTKYNYFRRTKKATERFLVEGKTKINYNDPDMILWKYSPYHSMGWVNTLSKSHLVENILISPNQRVKKRKNC